MKEERGFLKYVCEYEPEYWSEPPAFLYKCHNSEELYWSYIIGSNNFLINRVAGLCSKDQHFYQVCGTRTMGRITNEETLCENYICELDSGKMMTTVQMKERGLHCNRQRDCVNTFLDESGCSDADYSNSMEWTTLLSGKRISSKDVCDGVCNFWNCEDEADCGGYHYGVSCTYYLTGNFHFTASFICDGWRACRGGVDEENCAVTNETQYTCEHSTTGKIVPVLNITRCHQMEYAFGKEDDGGLYLLYCKNYAPYQTNCSDTAKIGGYCLMNGYMSSFSKFMICRGEKACDDNIENQCLNTSTSCSIHKHLLCDGKQDCNDE